MAGMIYRPHLPHPHNSIVLRHFSLHLPADLHYILVNKVTETNATLDIAIEEDSAEGRLYIAKRMMLIPHISHWHMLRFGDITKKERGEIRQAMLRIRSDATLHVR